MVKEGIFIFMQFFERNNCVYSFKVPDPKFVILYLTLSFLDSENICFNIVCKFLRYTLIIILIILIKRHFTFKQLVIKKTQECKI